MDFPIFFVDLIGNRLIIAIVASLHVFINHPLAVGAYPLVVLLEWWGYRTKNPDWDRLAYKITFTLFIITTSIGAMTGVGIWFTTALIAPFGIGSLLRVFFWGWFIEWLIFISEVVLIMIYFLTWKRWSAGGWKKGHIAFGIFLSVFSWLTMAIIVGILGFMMDPGGWPVTKTLFSAFFNPIYLPQLAFRTTLALALAGLFILLLIHFFTRKQFEFRHRAVRLASGWTFIWTIPFLVSSLWYWHVVPEAMKANIDVALLTQKFMQWHETLAIIMAIVIGVLLVVTLIGIIKSRLIPGVLLIVPFVLGLWLLGHFERTREFVRKPYIIADYMYSNGVRMAELPVLQRDGVLTYASYVKHHSVTSSNLVEAGRDVFLLTCSRCHSTRGVNSVIRKFENLYGTEPWDKNAILAFISSMHITRTYMPPFPGNDKEAEALTAYLKSLRIDQEYIFGAQSGWTMKPAHAGTAARP
jgi:mono/diheme cytochrome c family protein